MVFQKISRVTFFILSLVCFVMASVAVAEKPLNIALVLWRGETDAERGFRDALRELGYHANYTTLNADQNLDRLSDLLKTLNPNDYQYLYTFGTPVSLMIKKDFQGVTPQVFTTVLYPAESGLVQNLFRPGVNISGASHFIPMAIQLDTALSLLDFSSLGVFYNPRDANSAKTIQEIRNVSIERGFSLKTYPVRPGTDRLNKYLRLLEKGVIDVDAVYLPSDSYIVSQSQAIAKTLKRAKIPGFASVEDCVKKGILFGVTTNYYDVGRAAAAIVDQVERGKALSAVPVSLPQKNSLLINKTTARALGFKPDRKLTGNARWIE